MAKKYKYSCRECTPRVRSTCIQQAHISPGAKRIIDRAFRSRTDTEATWDLLQRNCLLIQRDQMVNEAPASKEQGLLSRMRQQERKRAAQKPEREKTAPPVISVHETGDLGLLGRMRRSERKQEETSLPVVAPPSPTEPRKEDQAPTIESPVHREPQRPLAPSTRPSLWERIQKRKPKTTEIPLYQRKSLARRRAIPSTESLQYPPVSRPQPSQFPLAGPKMLVASVSGHRILLPEDGELVLGRFDPRTVPKPDVDLTFEDRWDQGISRRHVRICGRGNRYMITDLGSSNGTWINGRRLSLEQAQELHVGDEVRLGNSILYFDQVPELYKMPDPPGQFFLFGTFTGHFFPLPAQASILIGRADPTLGFKPDIDLSSEGEVASVISRRHAKLIRNGSQFMIEDLGSVNKTRVNGQPVYMGTQVPIKPGQHLWLGGCVLAFDVVEMPNTPASSSRIQHPRDP